MIFGSIFFLFIFLPITLILYYIVPMKVKDYVLLLCSLIFYAWGEPVYVLLMIFSILFNYFSGLAIDSYKRQKDRRLVRFTLVFSIIVNLAMLGFFKYFGLFVSTFCNIFSIQSHYSALALPVGISFYTFQAMSYVIDLYWGNVRVQKNVITFGVYITMFPQLIAGPIVRYTDIVRQLKNKRLDMTHFIDGVAWFIRGLSKKVLLANNIGAVHEQILALSERSIVTAWVGALCYTMQIYFDFGGYSDMAIGLGKMLGFDFVKNFDYPYTSKSVTEFWRRWHISLGTWFREYVYIPLGGNRGGTLKNVRNIMIVWMLTGFWHGAAWNFLLWGIYYGILLILEKFIFKKVLDIIPGFIREFATFILVVIGWVIFFSNDITSAFSYFGNMFGSNGTVFFDSDAGYYLASNIILLVICFIASRPFVWNLSQKFFRGREASIKYIVGVVIYSLLLFICIAYMVNNTYNPFLYFRF